MWHVRVRAEVRTGIFVGRSEGGKKPIGRPRKICEDNITTDL